MLNSTAIIFFTRSDATECAGKKFGQGFNLFHSLNRCTLKTIKSTQLPYFVVTEREQIGDSFGERFISAIQDVYNKGYHNVITVGNDTPHLTKAHLLKTAEQLKNKPLVLGPSKDGGFYLMGLNKSYFNPTTFLKLPWQTANLTKSITRLITKKCASVVFLETLQDIDNVNDIWFILRDKTHSIIKILKQLLLKIVLNTSKLIRSQSFFLTSYFTSSFYNKGSPRLVTELT